MGAVLGMCAAGPIMGNWPEGGGVCDCGPGARARYLANICAVTTTDHAHKFVVSLERRSLLHLQEPQKSCLHA